MAELNGKYVNEENHQKVKKSLKKVGLILLILGAIFLVVGIILLIVGIANFTSNFDMPSFPSEPTAPTTNFSSSTVMFILGGLLMAFGFGMGGYGIYAVFFAHGREILSYGASTIAPVVGETVSYMADKTAPAIEKVVGSVASGISGGIAAGKNKVTKKLKCPKCEALNEADAKFCGNCGAKFKVERFCSNCGQKLEQDAKFCSSCGAKVE